MRTVMVTGATRGIGAALVEMLTGRGDRVLAVVRDAAALDRLGGGHGGLVEGIVADLERPGDLAAAVRGVTRLDALVHCAGIVDVDTVADLTPEVWRRELAVNLQSPAELTRLLLPALRESRGQVVFVNSGAGLATRPLWAAYAASKHGLKALADALRTEETGRVRVCSVYPGQVDTDMQRELREDLGADFDPSRAMKPATVAGTIVAALDLPEDAMVMDLRVVPPDPAPFPSSKS